MHRVWHLQSSEITPCRHCNYWFCTWTQFMWWGLSVNTVQDAECVQGLVLASTSREAPIWEKSWIMCMKSFTELFWQHTKQDCSQRNPCHCQRYLSFQPGWSGALQVEFQWIGSHQLWWPSLGRWEKTCCSFACLVFVMLHPFWWSPASVGPQLSTLLLRHSTWKEEATQQSCHTTTSIWS